MELENREYDVTAVAEVKSIQDEHIENPNQKRCVTELIICMYMCIFFKLFCVLCHVIIWGITG